MWQDNQLVPFSYHAFASIDRAFQSAVGWPKFTPYSRKHGLITESYGYSDFTDLDRIILARHTKSSRDNSATLSYAITPAWKKRNNVMKMVKRAEIAFFRSLLDQKKQTKRKRKQSKSAKSVTGAPPTKLAKPQHPTSK